MARCATSWFRTTTGDEVDRFAAALVDGFLVMGIMLPIQLITGYLERAGNQSLGMLEQIAMSLHRTRSAAQRGLAGDFLRRILPCN
jgi:hypothetical protein